MTITAHPQPTGVAAAAPPALDYVPPSRRAQVILSDSDLRSMIGLAADEYIVAVQADPVSLRVTVVIDSPRLPRNIWVDCEPQLVTRPIAQHYEAGDEQLPHYAPGSLSPQEQLYIAQEEQAAAQRLHEARVEAAERRVAQARQQ